MKHIQKGTHYLINFFGCDKNQLNSLDFWKKILPGSVSGSKLKILNSAFHKFKPNGVTGVLLLSSSHLSIHTWPEYSYVACDLFSCSDDKYNEKVVKKIIKSVKHKKVEIKKIKRGYVIY